jgi:hypothetical protein
MIISFSFLRAAMALVFFFDSSMLSLERLLHPPSPPPRPLPKENATDFCTALCLLVLGIKARQNSCRKAAKLEPKGSKTEAKSQQTCSN